MSEVPETSGESVDEPNVLLAAGDLTEAFHDFTEQLKVANDLRFTRVRRIVIGLAVSVALDLLLSAGYIYTQVEQNDNQISQCQQNNVARVQDRAIWDRILMVPSSASAATKKEQAQLARLVSIKDTPRNCKVIYKFHI
jgi:hypothetical protein